MKKGIYAAWCHVSSSSDNNFHVHCPAGPNSWCIYQCDLVNGTSTYKPGNGLLPSVIKHVKSVFENLSSDELLSKCLEGKTQNQNEAFMGPYGTVFQKYGLYHSKFLNYRYWMQFHTLILET